MIVISLLLIGGVILLLAANRTMAAPPTLEWSGQNGTPVGEAAFAIATDQQGNVYVGGDTDGALYGTARGESDTFLAKYSPTGQLLWGKQFGGVESDSFGAMAMDANGNICIVGTTLSDLHATNAGRSDCFVIKLSPSGETLWSKQFGTSGYDLGNGVAIDMAGGIFVVGQTDGNLFRTNPDPVCTDAFIVKYESDGDLAWSKQFGTEHDDMAESVATDGQGFVYVAGQTLNLFSPDSQSDDVMIVKFDTDGQQVWGKQFGSPEADHPIAIQTDGNGNVYVGGAMHIGGDSRESGYVPPLGFLTKYDPTGSQLWLRNLQNSRTTGVSNIALDPQNAVYVAGSTAGDLFGSNLGEDDAFLVKYDSAGTAIWSYQFGTAAFDAAHGIAVHGNGKVLVCGMTEGGLYGTSAGGEDLFMVRFAQP